MVVNVAIATPEVAAERGWVECPDGVGIGWSFDGAELLPPPPDTDGEAAQVRAERDRLLAESDLMVMPDRWSAMSVDQQAAWSTYRQALRDLPQQAGFPWSVDWPEKPAT